MEITNRFKKLGDIAEVTIYVYLLQICLFETFGVLLILLVWPAQNLLAPNRHFFALDERPLVVVLGEVNFISPDFSFCVVAKADLDADIGVAPSGIAPQRRYSVASANRLLKAATHRHDVMKESEAIQKVGFTRRVWPHKKHA